jgi:hypothetical protein
MATSRVESSFMSDIYGSIVEESISELDNNWMPCCVFFTLVLSMMTMVWSMSEQVLGLIVSDLTCIFYAHLCCLDFLGYFSFFCVSLVVCKLYYGVHFLMQSLCTCPLRTKALFLASL